MSQFRPLLNKANEGQLCCPINDFPQAGHPFACDHNHSNLSACLELMGSRKRNPEVLSSKRTIQAFSLLEVMLGIVILSIIAGLLYGVMSASISAGEQIEAEVNKQMQIAALVELFRKSFAALPPSTVITLKVREEGRSYLSEVRLENAPMAFAWGPRGFHLGAIILGLKVGSNGRLQLGIGREFENKALRHRNPMQWLLLTDDLTECVWEVYDVRTRQWLGTWNNASMPSLIRFRCKWQGDVQPIEVTFVLSGTGPN